MTAFRGAALMQWLEDNGVILAGGKYRRIIIDAPFDGICRIYVEMNADSPLLELRLPDVKAAEIVVLDGAK